MKVYEANTVPEAETFLHVGYTSAASHRSGTNGSVYQDGHNTSYAAYARHQKNSDHTGIILAMPGMAAVAALCVFVYLLRNVWKDSRLLRGIAVAVMLMCIWWEVEFSLASMAVQ